MSQPRRNIEVMTGGGQYDEASGGRIATTAWARGSQASVEPGRGQAGGEQPWSHVGQIDPNHSPPVASPGHPRAKKAPWIVIALAALFAIAALALSVTKLASGSNTAQTVTTTISPPAPTYSDADIATAKKDACAATTITGDALTQAQRELASIPDRNSPEAKAALANFQMVVMVETEYLKTQVRPATPEAIKSAVSEFIAALLAETDAETRMLPYGDINARGDAASAASKKLNLACKD